jgi:hypothetical protein
MSDDRDPKLQNLFAEAQPDLDAEEFVAGVMTRTRNLRVGFLAGLVCVALVLGSIAWLLAIPQELVPLIAQVMASSLIDLGDGWVAWMFLPVNNIGSVLVLTVKAIRVLRKKLIGAQFAY